MPSGFCVRVLLLSLLAFGPHAKALSYRSGGSGGIEPYFQVAEDFPGNHRPGLTLSSYESSAQPRGSLGSSGPSAGGYSDSYGRQVDGYSRERSVSSYKPDPMIRTKPRENPQQPRYQNNANIPQTKAGMWDVAFPQNVNRFESGIVSSHGIEMHSGRQSEDKPQQPKQPVYPPKPQQPKQPVYPPKPQQPKQPVYPPRPQQPKQPVYPPKPQQPKQPVYPPRPQQPKQPVYLPRPQQPKQPVYLPRPQQPKQPVYPPKPQQPQQPVYPPQQPKQPVYPPRPQQPQQPKQPVYLPRPQQPKQPVYPPKPQQPKQPVYPPKPQQPKQPVYPPKPQQPLQPVYPPRPQQPKQPVYPPKPQQPSYLAKPSVTQSKAGMWDFALSQDGAAFDPNEQPTDSAQPRSYDSWPATFQHQYLRSLRVHQ